MFGLKYMPKLNQRGVVHLLVPLILLAGLIAGVYLVTSGNPLKLFSKAANPPIIFKSLDGKVLPLNSNGVVLTTSPNVIIELTSTLGPSASASGELKGTVSYRAGFSPTEVHAASFAPYQTEPTVYNVSLKDTKYVQFYWVEFKGTDGQIDRRVAKIRIVPNLVPTSTINDDFENDTLPGWTITGTNDTNKIVSTGASTSGITAINGSKVLLVSSDGTSSPIAAKKLASPYKGRVSIWFYDPGPGVPGGVFVMVTNNAEDQVVMLGLNPVYPNNYYYRASANQASLGLDSGIPRKEGWRKFELVVTPKGSYGRIDDISLTYLANKEGGKATSVNPNLTDFTKIYIAAPWRTSGTYFFDDLKFQTLPMIPSDTVVREKYFLKKFLEDPMPAGTDGRPKAIRAAVAAYLNKNKDEAKKMIWDLANSYPSWIREAKDRQTDGSATPADYWTGTFVSSSLGLAAWIMWPELDAATQAKVKEAIFAQAEKYLDLQPRSTFEVPGQAVGLDPNNTAAEENAAIANTLILVSRMFPREPKASTFEAQGKKFAFHTLTKSPGESYSGRTTAVADENYLIAEHALYHNLNYGLAAGVGMLGSAAGYYLRSGQAIPDELSHNVRQVFEAHKQYLDFTNYRVNFKQILNGLTTDKLGGKDDWAVDGTYYNSGFALYAYLTGNADVLSQLEEYELYVTRDFLAFPADNSVKVYFPGCEVSGVAAMEDRCEMIDNNFYYSSAGKYVINSAIAWSHLVAAILFDSSFSLPSTEKP